MCVRSQRSRWSAGHGDGMSIASKCVTLFDCQRGSLPRHPLHPLKEVLGVQQIQDRRLSVEQGAADSVPRSDMGSLACANSPTCLCVRVSLTMSVASACAASEVKSGRVGQCVSVAVGLCVSPLVWRGQDSVSLLPACRYRMYTASSLQCSRSSSATATALRCAGDASATLTGNSLSICLFVCVCALHRSVEWLVNAQLPL